MTVNLIGLLCNAADCIPANRDVGAYRYMLREELVNHIKMVRKGQVSLEEFARHYRFAPETPSTSEGQARPGARSDAAAGRESEEIAPAEAGAQGKET